LLCRSDFFIGGVLMGKESTEHASEFGRWNFLMGLWVREGTAAVNVGSHSDEAHLLSVLVMARDQQPALDQRVRGLAERDSEALVDDAKVFGNRPPLALARSFRKPDSEIGQRCPKIIEVAQVCDVCDTLRDTSSQDFRVGLRWVFPAGGFGLASFAQPAFAAPQPQYVPAPPPQYVPAPPQQYMPMQPPLSSRG
jgi:hypothetical protein